MRVLPRAVASGLTALLCLGLVGPAFAQMNMPPHSFQEVVDRAREQNRPILLEIYAPWCPYCQRMQETVYGHAEVRAYLDSQFVYARLNRDTTEGTHRFAGRTLTTKELGAALARRGVPTTVFMRPDGRPIAHQPGFIERPTFLTMLRFIGSGAYRNQGFQEFARRRSK